MPVVLLDTNAISDLMMDHALLKARVLNHPDKVLTSVVNLGEIRFGLNRLPAGKKRTDLERRARQALSKLPLEPVNEAIAEEYARLKAALESQGLNLGENDLWIAATSLLFNYTLVTRDKIFTRIPGLVIEDWSQ